MPIYHININNKVVNVEASANMPLLWVLRDLVGLKGTKFGCGMALCGACTIHIDGVAVRSCQQVVSEVGNKKIVTIEGLSKNGDHPLQIAWQQENVPQCGYCQGGQIMNAAALLAKNPHPSDQQIDAAQSGNICRCGTYPRIRKAIKRAAKFTDKT